jgi:hypothetical protein
MAAAPVISNAAARAALNAITALINVGGAGVIKIFTGSPPASCETADTGTLLATLTPSSTAFANAVDNSSGGATATANAITSGTAAATGTAGYFRAYPNTPTTTNAVIQGTVGASSADMIISSTSINTGDTVSCSSWTVTLPDGSGSD